MSALEKDAKKRTEQRRQNKIRADEWKAKGNDAFHQQLYEQAIEFYTQVEFSVFLNRWNLETIDVSRV